MFALKFLSGRPEYDLVDVHLVRLADGKGHRARERVGRNRELLIKLVKVLGEVRLGDAGYHLYYPSRRQATPAFRVLVDELRYRR